MDPYKELGVSPSASDDEIKTAYRNLVKKYHPDRYANAPKDVQDSVSEKVKRINAAYDEIKRIRSGGASSGYGGTSQSYGSSYGYGGASYGGSSSSGPQYASSEQFQDIREMIRRGLILQAAEALKREWRGKELRARLADAKTACDTRARELLLLVGNEELIAQMTQNNRRNKRYSGLRFRLQGEA